jgi:hypothetical protein
MARAPGALLKGPTTRPLQQLRDRALVPIHPNAWRDCMKTPDRCRTGTPPSAENGPTGLYFGVLCYRRPTIGTSPTTFHTVSPRLSKKSGQPQNERVKAYETEQRGLISLRYDGDFCA